MNHDELPKVLQSLAAAIERLAASQERIAPMLEVLIEAMPAKTEAKILGLCENTVRKNRKTRRELRLMR